MVVTEEVVAVVIGRKKKILLGFNSIRVFLGF